jgi:hypothetical protein
MIALAIVVVAFVSCATIAHGVDRLRGVDSEALATLEELNDRLQPDDAPWWAEVAGMLLAPGLTFRGGCHVWMALLAGAPPDLADSDIHPGNAVESLRGGAWQVDLAGRICSLSVAVAFLSRASLWASGGAEMIIQLFAALNLAVLCCDPLLYLIDRHSPIMFNTTPETHEVNSNGRRR